MVVVAHEAIVPVFEHPFRLDTLSGEFSYIEQDSFEDIIQSVEVLLQTVVGSRIELPTYGVDDMLFRSGLDTNEILARVAEWEPRAVALVDADYNELDSLITEIRVRLRREEL